MTEAIDEHFLASVASWTSAPQVRRTGDAARLAVTFRAQLLSRHVDFAARWLQGQGEGFYTIGSAGHESNAAVALALRPTDPALLHYRSGAFFLARAMQAGEADPVDDMLAGVVAATSDPISGGRHKVVGSKKLNIIPQTSTIGSHLPRAFGLAYALGQDANRSTWPSDAVVVASIGDASVNHSTTLGALNAASYLAFQRMRVPLLVVCEDNGIGISTTSPPGWVEQSLRSISGFEYATADGTRTDEVLDVTDELVASVRTRRRPAILHLRTVRFMGHAGSDAEIAYRPAREIEADFERDPLLASARLLVDLGELRPADVLDQYERARADVMGAAKRFAGSRRLGTFAEVIEPIALTAPESTIVSATDDRRRAIFAGRLPEEAGPMTLAQTITASLKDALAARPGAVVFGQDVGRKGGVYGLTRGLQKAFGPSRVFDTLLDEQTILGTALGMALAGHLPIPEIQYLAYLHNAEDQLRGEAATLRFFSNGQYENGMVIRIAGLAYQKGFGGHFHNDNSVAVLRDIPGLVVAVPSHPMDAGALLRTCLALADDGAVCVFVEPIALYHQPDLHGPADGLWLSEYSPPSAWDVDHQALGEVRVHGHGTDCLLVTFGNGVPMSLRAAQALATSGIKTSVLDLQWLAPLPAAALLAAASTFDHVLVVDETRAGGGVSESVLAALVDGGYRGEIGRVTSADSFVPLGPAADAVLLSEFDIIDAVSTLLSPPITRPR